MNYLVIIILSSLFFSGCVPLSSNKIKIRANNNKSGEALRSQVASVQLINNQLIINGAYLANVEKVTLKTNSTNEVFKIESSTENKIVANTLRNVNLAVGTIFDLILSNAMGAATYQVTFTLTNGSVTTSKIADGAVTSEKLAISASTGEFLKYNGTNWVGASVYDAQTFLGTWDASTLALPTPIGNIGEYYIVSDDGTFGAPSVAYKAGDWIISDGVHWKRIVYSSSVSSFNTRRNAVTLLPSDYSYLVDSGTHKITGSKLVDIADINITSLTDGQVLKWDSSTSKWVNGSVSGGGSPSLSATAPLSYSSGTISISTATTTDAGVMSSADKTKLDTVPTFPTGDGLLERFSGTFLMRTCSPGQMLVFFSGTGWTCSTTLVMEGDSAQTISMSRNPTSNTAGNNLTVEASGATSGATDKTGGNLILSSGTSTGTGSSNIEFKTSNPAATTSSSDNIASTKMTILGNGNVGIGTTAPFRKLHVYSETANSAGLFEHLTGNLNGTGSPLALIRTTAGDMTTGFGPMLSFIIKDSADVNNDIGQVGAVREDNDGTGAIVFKTAITGTQSERMRLTSKGNIGIGTTTPTSSLHIVKTLTTGTISSTGTTVTGSGTNFTTAFSVGDQIVASSQAKIITGIASATSLTVNSAFTTDLAASSAYARVGAAFASGYVGVGTDAPQSPLHVESPTGGLLVRSTSAAARITIKSATDVSNALTFRNEIPNKGWSLYNLSSIDVASANGLMFESFDGTSYVRRYTFSEFGNMGIGVATPLATIHAGKTAPTGTLTTVGTAVTGTGSNFLTSFSVGDTIIVNGAARTVSAITNNTSLTLASAYSSDVTVATAYSRVGAIFNSGSVGIGTTAPGTALDVIGDIRSSTKIRVGTGSAGISTAGNDINLYDASGNLTYRGTRSSTAWSDGASTQWFQIGNSTDNVSFSAASGTSTARMKAQTTSFQIATGPLSNVPAGLFEVSNGTAGVFNVLSSGNVGIGISAPTAPLHVVTANTTGSIAIFSAPSSMGCSISTSGTTCSSDIRLKENVESVDSLLQLDNILKIRPVHFTWKADNEHKKQTGFIAQELEKIFPEFVVTDDKGFKQVNYAHFVSVLTSGVQNLYKKWFVHERAIASINQKLEVLERENRTLKEENESLKKGNEKIQTRLEAIERKLKIK